MTPSTHLPKKGEGQAHSKRDINLILVAIVISGVTTFMFYPLITLELMDRGETTATTGLILGLLAGTGRILSGPIGWANARLGSKALTIGGFVFRSAGLLVLAPQLSPAIYAVGSIIASVGSSATALALKTELMRYSASRKTITFRSIAVNIGALVGPSIGGAVYMSYSFATIIWLVVGSYLALALLLAITVRFLPAEEKSNVPTTPQPAGHRSGAAFFWLLVCTFAYWAIYAQWSLVVPIYAESGFGTPLGSTWVFTGNAILILLFQYLVLVRVMHSVSSEGVFCIGFLAFAAAFIVLFFPPTPFSVILFATAFSLAELLISPTLDEVTAQIKPAGSGMTRAYGITASVSGVASLACTTVGGYLIDSHGNPGAVGWLILPTIAIGSISAVAMKRLKELT